MNERSTTGVENVIGRLDAVEQRLAALQEALVALQATNQRLVEQTSKLEAELRRERWWRSFWAIIRWLIVLGVIGALLYLFDQWKNVLQFFV
jgi:membrane protein required for beta-lactamase induction